MKRLCLVGLTTFLALGQLLALAGQQATSFREGCGPADPAYIRTATETGGIPMFLQRSEAAKAFHLVRESTRNNISTVLWAAGALESQAIFEVPIDSLTQRITFTFSFDREGNNVAVVAPSRGAVRQNSSDTEVTELRCGRIVTVAAPDAGNWHVELTGKGRFWMEAQAQSGIHFGSVEFVRAGGRPGHEGWYRIDGQPIAGRPATIRASLFSSEAKTVEFYFATDRGEPMRSLQLHSIGSTEEFLGTADLPEGPFRVAVKGIDSNGSQYQRFFGPLFHAESVEVSWIRTFDELPVGSLKLAEFSIRNTGPARTFKLTVTDAHKFVSKVEPTELTLGPGQSGIIRVALMVPTGTLKAVGDDVVVVATTNAGPPTSNSSIAHFSVLSPGSQSNQ